MGVKLQKPQARLEEFLKDFVIVQRLPSFKIIFIEDSINGFKKQYLLKEYHFQTYTDAYEYSNMLEEKCHYYKKCPYLIELSKYFLTDNNSTGDETIVCALFQYPYRTLDHQRSERSMKNMRFNQVQIWSILMTCTSALNFLYQKNVRHLNVNSSNITLDQQGFMRIFDPNLVKNYPNYSQVLNKQASKNIYICPELCESLKLQRKVPDADPYLSDVFTLGMLMLQIGLMEYMNQCYTENYEDFYYHILEQKIQRFSQLYSISLTMIIKQMLKPIHLRSSYRRVLYLIRKNQPPESRFSSYNQQLKPFNTPSQKSILFSEKSIHTPIVHDHKDVLPLPMFRGVTFASPNSVQSKDQFLKRSMKDTLKSRIF